MDEIIQDLKRRASEIRTEETEYANSAERIGQWLYDVAEKLGITIEEMQRIINKDDGSVAPEGGWQKTDLSTDVQSSLGKADTALQQHQSLEGYARINDIPTVPSSLQELDSTAAEAIRLLVQDIGNTLNKSLGNLDAAGQLVISNIVNDIIGTAIEQLSNDLAKKVDKEEGKGLSSNDYTNEDKAKLSELLVKDASVVDNKLLITKTDNTVIEFEGGGGTIDAETVRVVIRTTVEGVSVAGLKLYVYLNDDTQTPKEYTTDENGMCAFKVTADYKYRIIFPDIEDCNPVPDVVHTAVLKERAIEVTYEAEAVEVEIVNVYVKKFEDGTNAPWANHAVKVDIEGAEYDYQTDNNGLVEFEVPIGVTYTVSVDRAEGLYVPTGYSHTFMARKTTRNLFFNYYGEAIGLFIVDKFGNEYSNTEWVATGKPNEDAMFIKIATPELLNDNGKGVYYVKIDDIYNAEYLKLSKHWCTQNVQFNSIPADGNRPTALYYYDGMGASAAVLEEAGNRSLVVTAFTECDNKEETLGNGEVMKGFLWSVGQNRMLYNNREMLDSIIRLVRPDAVNDFSLLCRSTAWTSTQNDANGAFCVSAGVSSNNKRNSYSVLVCYAPSV